MKIEALRRAFGDTPFTAAEAAALLDVRSPYSTLTRLKEAGVLERVGRGAYRFAPPERGEQVADHLEREAIRTLRARRDEEVPELARLRWQAWQKAGYVVPVGPRRLRVNVGRPVRRVDARRR